MGRGNSWWKERIIIWGLRQETISIIIIVFSYSNVVEDNTLDWPHTHKRRIIFCRGLGIIIIFPSSMCSTGSKVSLNQSASLNRYMLTMPFYERRRQWRTSTLTRPSHGWPLGRDTIHYSGRKKHWHWWLWRDSSRFELYWSTHQFLPGDLSPFISRGGGGFFCWCGLTIGNKRRTDKTAQIMSSTASFTRTWLDDIVHLDESININWPSFGNPFMLFGLHIRSRHNNKHQRI